MTQVASNEALRPDLPCFQAGVFTGEEWKGAAPPSRQRTVEEERELTERAIRAMRACQLSARRNGIDKLTAEEFDELVYGD